VNEAADNPAARSPIRRIVLTVLFFVIVGPLIGGPIAVPIIWYFSFSDMNISQAIISGLIVTVLGFWAIIPAGLIPAAGVGGTVVWCEMKFDMTGMWVPVVAGLSFGVVWGSVLQFNVEELTAVIPAVTLGSVVASLACWWILRRARAMRTRRQA
jgi:hypothetical protein